MCLLAGCVWKHWAQWSAWCKAPRAAGVSREGTGPGQGSSSQLNVSVPEAQASAFLAGRSQELSDMHAASCVMQADARLRPPQAGAGPASLASPATGGVATPSHGAFSWHGCPGCSARLPLSLEENQAARVVSFPRPWGQGHSAPESRGLPTSPHVPPRARVPGCPAPPARPPRPGDAATSCQRDEAKEAGLRSRGAARVRCESLPPDTHRRDQKQREKRKRNPSSALPLFKCKENKVRRGST